MNIQTDHADPQSSKAATPMAFVRAVLWAYARYGADPSNALSKAQILPSTLCRSDAFVTAAQFETICNAAMQELNDEALGWFSRRLPWGTYGMLCRASLTSPNLGVALKRWCRHHQLLTEDIVFRLTIENEVATLSIDEQRSFGEVREFCLLTSMRYIHGYACWLIDSRMPLLAVNFPFKRPLHGRVHTLLFPGPVHFDTAGASFQFDSQYLALSPRRDENSLRTMLQRALPLTVLQYRRDRILSRRVRHLISMQPSEQHTAHDLSELLNLSVRTLHRQLSEEKTSLQEIKDSVRREFAIDQLSRTIHPIKQIAVSAGFSSKKSFARAFKNWTGETASDFRQKRMPEK